eukprot:scaffold33660_cov87-Skeletonema_dohrnii-CCMP3373.AAC.4
MHSWRKLLTPSWPAIPSLDLKMQQPVYRGLDSSAVKLKKRGKRTHTELKRLMGKFLPKNST